ncbi:MAG: Beta-barrel assembly-enhancing protease [Candidatus Anoxychlamydiales bacterium]|nr:Beta-barrel assembly-enhancing protease [Candidatus Anoxychlamydiales bacterium]HEU64902.1 tetratricopeptide repeat protein [Chlamydiota bacterium]
MKKAFFLLFLIFLNVNLYSIQKLPGLENFQKSKIKQLYKNLDQRSVVQHFAFYKLYPESEEGKLALKKAWNLLKQENVKDPLVLPTLDINLMINLVNNQNAMIPDDLDEEKLDFLESLGKNLKNRNLKGNNIWKKDDILKLENNEIDIARALFLEELGEEKESIYKIRYYEATLDLMALQILAKLNTNPTDIDKVNAINDFIFYEKRFRFPPHSIHAKQIDTYTFLSSVMDSRRGVCLGVSVMYLSLAQRLGLDLEIITPPGHIYVRYKDKDGNITNIETTARGVDYPSDVYLGIETKKLQQRTIKEVPGMVFFNQASLYWANEKYETAIELYEKALKYMPDDPNVKMLLGLNLLFVNRVKEGKKYFLDLKDFKSEYLTTKENIVDDFLSKKTDIESMKAIFLTVDETRDSIIKKQKSLMEIVKKYPSFRGALFQLINTYLQLGREKDALVYLNKYYEIDETDPIANYYIAAISFERFDYLNAWKYLKNTEKILKQENHYPKALKSFKEALKRAIADPSI